MNQVKLTHRLIMSARRLIRRLVRGNNLVNFVTQGILGRLIMIIVTPTMFSGGSFIVVIE